MITFKKPGYKNTEKCLDTLDKAIEEYGIDQVVVASTHGITGLSAAKRLKSYPDVKLIVVTHNVGFKEFCKIEMAPETKREIEELGGIVHTGTMALRNIGTAIREKHGYSEQDIIANTLRILGQGIKVCVEIVLMASDSGLLSPKDVLAIAGTARGADTSAILKPASSNRLFDIKIREILAKPRDW